MTIPPERLDRLCTQLQETGEATDLPDYLLAAAKQIGLREFTLTDQGVMLYRLTARPSSTEAARQALADVLSRMRRANKGGWANEIEDALAAARGDAPK